MPRRKLADSSNPIDVPPVNKASTKAEIMDAYQQLVSQLEDVEVDTPVEAEEQPQQRLTLEAKHKITTVDEVLKQLTDLKLKINKAVSEVTEGLVDKGEQLNELIRTIALEEKYLAEVEQIKTTAKSLKQLVRLQEQQQQIFAKETNEKRQAWETEQQQRQRGQQLSEDEYQYELKRKRREEEEEYQFKQQQKIQELKNREILIKQTEDELQELRKMKESWPRELDQAVESARKVTKAEAEKEAAIKQNLLEKQVDGDRKLAEAQITNLRDTVKAQAERIASLERQLSQANDRVKDIATGAVSFGKGRGEEDGRKSGSN